MFLVLNSTIMNVENLCHEKHTSPALLEEGGAKTRRKNISISRFLYGPRFCALIILLEALLFGCFLSSFSNFFCNFYLFFFKSIVQSTTQNKQS